MSNPHDKHLYFTVPNSPTPTPVTVTANPYNETVTANPYNKDTVLWPLGLGFVLLIICIACVIHMHYKGKQIVKFLSKLMCMG